MKRFLKYIFGILLVLVLVAGGTIAYFVVYFDDILKDNIEAVVPQITQTEFAIGKIETSLLDGKIAISELHLENPDGFPEGHAIKFDKIFVHVDWKSLQSGKIIINSFILDGLDVFLLKEGGNKSNLSVILDTINSYVEEFKKSQEPADTEKEKPIQKKIRRKLRFQVNLLELNDARALVHRQKLLTLEAEVTIPEAKLENVGANGKGLTLPELVEVIMKEVIEEVNFALKVKRAQEEEENLEKGEKGAKENKGLSEKLQKLLTPKAKK